MEDAAMIRRIGEEESVLLYINSDQRDRATYPDAASYTVTFDQPIRNVVNIDVLGALLPSTMYVVDEHNRLAHTLVVGVNDTGVNAAKLARMPQYLEALLRLDRGARRRAQFADDHRTLVRQLRVFDDDLDAAPTPTPAADLPGGDDLLLFVTGESGRGERSEALSTAGRFATLVYGFADSTAFPLVLQTTRFPVGNYRTLTQLLEGAATGGGGPFAMTVTGEPGASAYVRSVSAVADRLAKVKLESVPWAQHLQTTRALVAFNTEAPFARVLGMRTRGRNAEVKTPVGTFICNAPAADASALTQDLQGPDIVDMSGERFVILRSPEIEAGMYSTSSLGIKAAGIGVFRLNDPGQFRDQRQEYVTVVRRPFHPIGKLDKISLRFEMGSTPGKLYDFKGVDHLLLVAIKVMVAGRCDSIGTSALNPNYDPDFARYSAQHLMRAAPSDTTTETDDDEDRDATADDIAKAMRIHDMFNRSQGA